MSGPTDTSRDLAPAISDVAAAILDHGDTIGVVAVTNHAAGTIARLQIFATAYALLAYAVLAAATFAANPALLLSLAISAGAAWLSQWCWAREAELYMPEALIPDADAIALWHRAGLVMFYAAVFVWVATLAGAVLTFVKLG